MFAKLSHHRTLTLVAAMALLIGLTLAGCQLFDNNSSSLTAPTTETVRPENFIIGDVDGEAWGGQYAEDNTYFMVNIPVIGAVKVEYTITGGATYAIFVETQTPTKWEIGLNTVDGVTDTLQSVCVTYTEDNLFASVPADATTSTRHQATHYLRTLENGTENWWPIDAAFGFTGETKTTCVVTDGVVQGDEVAGPFPKSQGVTVTYQIEASGCSATPNGTGSVQVPVGSFFTVKPGTDAYGDCAVCEVTVNGNSQSVSHTYGEAYQLKITGPTQIYVYVHGD